MEGAASKIFLGPSWHVPAARPFPELVIKVSETREVMAIE